MKDLLVCASILFVFGAAWGVAVLGYQTVTHAPDATVALWHWFAAHP